MLSQHVLIIPASHLGFLSELGGEELTNEHFLLEILVIGLSCVDGAPLIKQILLLLANDHEISIRYTI